MSFIHHTASLLFPRLLVRRLPVDTINRVTTMEAPLNVYVRAVRVDHDRVAQDRALRQVLGTAHHNLTGRRGRAKIMQIKMTYHVVSSFWHKATEKELVEPNGLEPLSLGPQPSGDTFHPRFHKNKTSRR